MTLRTAVDSARKENTIKNAIAVKEQVIKSVFAELTSLIKSEYPSTVRIRITSSSEIEVEDINVDVSYVLRIYLADRLDPQKRPLSQGDLRILTEERCAMEQRHRDKSIHI